MYGIIDNLYGIPQEEIFRVLGSKRWTDTMMLSFELKMLDLKSNGNIAAFAKLDAFSIKQMQEAQSRVDELREPIEDELYKIYLEYRNRSNQS